MTIAELQLTTVVYPLPTFSIESNYLFLGGQSLWVFVEKLCYPLFPLQFKPFIMCKPLTNSHPYYMVIIFILQGWPHESGKWNARLRGSRHFDLTDLLYIITVLLLCEVYLENVNLKENFTCREHIIKEERNLKMFTIQPQLQRTRFKGVGVVVKGVILGLESDWMGS